MTYSLTFPFSLGDPRRAARFRSIPADFIVEEVFEFEPQNAGEHLYLKLKKTGENTQFLADQLAQFFQVKKMDVSFCGMKDRNAITTQWFSIYLPGQDSQFDWQAFIQASGLNVELLDHCRHNKKLRRGDHRANKFTICLREIEAEEELEERLNKIKIEGVPNYFGEQRFGREASNLVKFAELLKAAEEQSSERGRSGRGKHKRKRNTRGMLISAARSWLFNQVLGERVRQENWQSSLPGEQHVEGNPSGPLWGRGRTLISEKVLELETGVLDPYRDWCNHLEHSGLSQERRALCILPQDFQWHWQTNNLHLSFALGSGQYATAVLREICILS